MSGLSVDDSLEGRDPLLYVKRLDELLPEATTPRRRTFCAVLAEHSPNRAHDHALFLDRARRYGREEVWAVRAVDGTEPLRVYVIHPTETEWRLARPEEWTEQAPHLFTFCFDEAGAAAKAVMREATRAHEMGMVRYMGNNLRDNVLRLGKRPQNSVILYSTGDASPKLAGWPNSLKEAVRLSAVSFAAGDSALRTGLRTLCFGAQPNAKESDDARGEEEAKRFRIFLRLGEALEADPEAFSTDPRFPRVTFYG